MNAVQHIIETVLSALVRQHEVYTTVVYPTRGKAVVLHDGLGISAERSRYETPEALQEEATFCTPNDSQLDLFDDDSDLLSMADEVSSIIGFADQWHTGSYTAVNPATGLPMLDGGTDVMGNPMGFDLHCFDDITGGFACAGFDAFDSCGGVSDFSL